MLHLPALFKKPCPGLSLAGPSEDPHRAGPAAKAIALSAADGASDKRVCALGHGFCQELRAIRKLDSVESSRFLSELSRLHITGHQNRVEAVLERFHLQAPIPITELELPGLACPHPVLRLTDTLETLAKYNKLDVLFHGHEPSDFKLFWERYKPFATEHKVYEMHGQELGACIPIMLHTDEGTGQKKKPVLILQVHAAMGAGSRRGSDMNYTGPSMLTRMLFTTIGAKQLKMKKNSKQQILNGLFQAWAQELRSLFEDGLLLKVNGRPTRIYLVPIASKGDWPALVQCGSLQRHFGHATKKGGQQKNGVCHLCKAGMQGMAWHDFGTNAEWYVTRHEAPLPWKVNDPPPLSALILNPVDPSSWFQVDLFHTCHKGVFSDLTASAAVACPTFVGSST